VPAGSTPLSKRREASVPSPSFLEVLRTLTGSKQALSISTRRVSEVISEFSPPMTPATATGRSPSQIISISRSSSRSFWSRVTNFSPWFAVRTTMRLSARRSRSKACRGCPHSSMTKLVTSTMLLIGRKPTDSSRSCSQNGEGLTTTLSSRRATYRGQCSGASMVTDARRWFGSSGFTGLTCGTVSRVLCMAAASRATPIRLRQSARFGVRSISNTGSERERAVFKAVPTGRVAFNTMMPSASSPKPSSAELQSIASERWPRISPGWSTVPFGRMVPGRATGASRPGSTLGAPQTTGRIPPPVSTRQTASRSADGWASTDRMRPTRTVSRNR